MEIHITGMANGVNRKGIAYEVLIQEKLIFKRGCRASGKFIPTSGVKQIIKGDKQATVDFGDGECDNIAILTIDGVSKEITIGRRGK